MKTLDERNRSAQRASADRLRQERDEAARRLEEVSSRMAGLGSRESLAKQLAASQHDVELRSADLDRHSATLDLRLRLRDSAQEQLQRYTTMLDALGQFGGATTGPTTATADAQDGSSTGAAPVGSQPGDASAGDNAGDNDNDRGASDANAPGDGGGVISGGQTILVRGRSRVPAPLVNLLVRYAQEAIAEAEGRLSAMEVELAQAREAREAAHAAWQAAQQREEDVTGRLASLEALESEHATLAAAAWQANERLTQVLQELGAEPVEPRDDEVSQILRHRRYPREVPEYLRVTVTRTNLEAAAERVLNRLTTTNRTFRREAHIDELQQLVGLYGVAANLVEVTNRLNRTKHSPITRRILAATYPWTLLQILRQMEQREVGIEPAQLEREQKGAEPVQRTPAQRSALREMVQDTVGFANRVREVQRGRLDEDPPVSPQQLFADEFVEEVSVRQRLRLPTGKAARKDLRARVLAGL
jgi:hypothetical protein